MLYFRSYPECTCLAYKPHTKDKPDHNIFLGTKKGLTILIFHSIFSNSFFFLSLQVYANLFILCHITPVIVWLQLLDLWSYEPSIAATNLYQRYRRDFLTLTLNNSRLILGIVIEKYLDTNFWRFWNRNRLLARVLRNTCYY